MLLEVACLAVAAYILKWLISPVLSSANDPPATSYQYQLEDGNATSTTSSDTPFPQALLWADDIYKLSQKLHPVYLSVVAPAYNEEDRLDVMMDETMTYLQARAQKDTTFTFEVIIVDDGSRDKTAQKVLEYTKKYGVQTVRLLRLQQNQGKGGAVQQGMLHSRGQYMLMVDADGATKFSDLEGLEKQMKASEKNGLGVVVGSRAHLETDAVAKRQWYRNILMYGFHFCVQVLGGVYNIRDTQCGFKLFSRKAAQILFTSQHLRRWCFDVELLYICGQMGIPVSEVAVNWQEIPGSKIRLVEASLLMGRDLLVIRFSYLLRIWRIEDPSRHTHSMNAPTQDNNELRRR